MGIKTEGFDRALRMMKQTAPDEAKKQVRASMRYSTNRAKAKLKAAAPVGKVARNRYGKFYAPGFLSRKGIVSRSRSSSSKGSFSAEVRLHADAFYGWVLNVGRYLTGGTYKKGKYVTPLRASRWIDSVVNPRLIAKDATSEFSKRFGK